MYTEATRAQILGTGHFLAWIPDERRCPIHLCTSDLTKLPQVGQENIVRGCDGAVVNGRGREDSLRLEGHQLALVDSSSSASWGCAGALPRADCPSSPCRTHPTLPCPPLLAKGQVLWGAGSLLSVQTGRILAWRPHPLSPPCTVPGPRVSSYEQR